jgi:hypothetical protein
MSTKKPALAFRKPPTEMPSAPPDPDQFVFTASAPSPQGLRDSGTHAVAGVADAKRKTITREDGRELRRMALYFPVDVAKRLAAHCATEDVDISSFVASLVRSRLAGPEGLGT